MKKLKILFGFGKEKEDVTLEGKLAKLKGKIDEKLSKYPIKVVSYREKKTVVYVLPKEFYKGRKVISEKVRSEGLAYSVLCELRKRVYWIFYYFFNFIFTYI